MAGQIPGLDGLRGLAVLLVVLRHAVHNGIYADDPVGLPGALAHVFWGGWIGVDLFFVLSGFLIARSLFSAGGAVSWRSYLLRRALRILPAYYVVLLLVVAGAVPRFAPTPDDLLWRTLYHLAMLQDYLGSDIVVVFWSLGVEEKFYLLAPLLVLTVARLRSFRLQVWFILGVLLLGPLTRLGTYGLVGAPAGAEEHFLLFRSPFHACVDGLFAGVLLARVHTAKPALWSRAQASRMFLLGGLLLSLVLLAPQLPHGFFSAVLWPLVLSGVMLLLVAGTVFEGAPAACSWGVLRWLGRISYSVYLVHYTMIPAAAAATLASCRLSPGERPPFGVFLVVLMLLTLASAVVLHYLVERPCLALKDKLQDSRAPHPTLP